MTRNTLKSNNPSRKNNGNYRVMKILLTMCFILIYNFLEARSLFRYTLDSQSFLKLYTNAYGGSI